ncbi:GTP cyclohydrolase I FolE [Candidatus Erwinia haradaeae]|uniref:GTP cyclohydrolase 1 n=1 Tax=Candidatus Erwinia haradaeae TaxID=1922217 RepID=A0A451D2Q0_9GAMM|nr:GTP cyclohydrolase I FolE [Candidatus Erwinia haradaeae]VFP79931.1 GTP cyclohydrolase 1 [Candidatus Erwinia haradaeae]
MKKDNWSPEAIRVHQELISCGLETPLKSSQCDIDHITQKKIIAKHMKIIMNTLNLNLDNKSLLETPNRIAKMYIDEIFSGLDYSNFPKISLIENQIHINEIVTIRNINLTSICEHHFLMIDGYATVAYIPQNKIIGLSKINRIVQFFSSRPQVQERLVQQILVALQTILDTNHVAVFIEAIHYCVKARGIHDTTSTTTTTAVGGLFNINNDTKQEFLRSIHHHKSH